MTTPGIQQRFAGLIEEHRKLLFKVCHAYGRSREEREDLAQEIVVQLWRNFASYDERWRFSTWMYRVALNVAISHLRRERSRTRPLLSGEEHLFEIQDESDPSAGLEKLQLLQGFLAAQAPLDRALLLLFLDGHSYAEIGQVLGISESNAATRTTRLKQAMQREFSETDSPPMRSTRA